MTLGWIGNTFILVAYCRLASKRRSAWIYSIIGNAFWCAYAVQLGLFDVLAIDLMALMLAVHGWIKWRE